jgi:hypothetical protein
MTALETQTLTLWRVETSIRREGYAGLAGVLALRRLIKKGASERLKLQAAALAVEFAMRDEPPRKGGAA